jgi:hypothetical protein
LFAIAADLIQCAINHEYQLGRLAPPFPQNADLPFPVVQYADDTIIVMQRDEQQLLILKDIPQKITISSGLKVNYHKSYLVPINIDAQKTELLAASFRCIVGSFPFTYLGLPLGLTKPLVRDFAPLICRVERRLAASSQFLSYAGRLQLISSVLSSLPTYYMCSLKLPVTVIDVMDRYRKNCLWRGKELNQKKYNLAAWDLVRRPKSKGGMVWLTLVFRIMLFF